LNRTYWVCAFVLVATAFGATAAFYPSLPDRMPIHWNFRGEVDGWGSPSTSWILPCGMVVLLGVFALLPKLSPKPFDLDSKSWTAYLFVMDVTMGLMAFIQAVTLWAAISPAKVDVTRPLVGGIMLMLALMGNVLGKIKRNLYMGVRTPWTIASERVWADTHRVAAWWFVGAGLAGSILAITPLPVWVALLPLIPAVLWPVLFSYLRYKELERNGELDLSPSSDDDQAGSRQAFR
jgi:uncharacterized membrane protein